MSLDMPAPRVFLIQAKKHTGPSPLIQPQTLSAPALAVVYRVEAGGTGKALTNHRRATSHAARARSKWADAAGTEGPGCLYRFGAPMIARRSARRRTDRTGTSRPARAARLCRGVAARDASAPLRAERSAAAAMAVASKPGESPSPTPSPTSRSSLFRIDANGNWDTIWETTDLIYDITAGDNDSLLIATGPKDDLSAIGP
jgi:hypothetical protein